jgi:hypothetical protein
MDRTLLREVTMLKAEHFSALACNDDGQPGRRHRRSMGLPGIERLSGMDDVVSSKVA